jgi:hypothetical protein
MKPITSRFILVFAILFFASVTTLAQTTSSSTSKSTTTEMKTYLIEREIPGAGKLTPEQLKSISQTSCNVLKEMAPHIEWIHSYVTGDKIFCIYKAENEALIREHAKKGGFPVNSITPISTVISPATAQ